MLSGDGSCISTGTAALEEDAQILKVIEAYCTSAKTRQTLNSSECHSSLCAGTDYKQLLHGLTALERGVSGV